MRNRNDDHDKEEFKKHPVFKKYSVGKLGTILSNSKRYYHKSLGSINGGKRGGYKAVMIEGRWIRVHHLVYQTWINPIIPEGYEIHHKNGNRLDNSACNLELLTREEHVRLTNEQRKVNRAAGITRKKRNIQAEKQNSGEPMSTSSELAPYIYLLHLNCGQYFKIGRSSKDFKHIINLGGVYSIDYESSMIAFVRDDRTAIEVERALLQNSKANIIDPWNLQGVSKVRSMNVYGDVLEELCELGEEAKVQLEFLHDLVPLS